MVEHFVWQFRDRTYCCRLGIFLKFNAEKSSSFATRQSFHFQKNDLKKNFLLALFLFLYAPKLDKPVLTWSKTLKMSKRENIVDFIG